jgi:hypothetical protein
MIDLLESSYGIKRFSIETHQSVRLFTEDVMDECLRQRFHDLSGTPNHLDFEVGRIYDFLMDWFTLNDDGYMWCSVLKKRYCGQTVIQESEIIGRIYTTVLISCFRKLEKDEIRNLKIEEITGLDVP